MQKRDILTRLAVYVLPVLLWMGVIYLASTPTGSAANTNPVIHSILLSLFPGIDRYLTAEQIHLIDVIIRKGAHVTEYAILAALTYRALRFGRPEFRHSYPLWTLIIGALYAASDEYHQSFVPSREGSVLDALIDVLGVAVGMALSLWGHCAEMMRRLGTGRGVEKRQEPP